MVHMSVRTKALPIRGYGDRMELQLSVDGLERWLAPSTHDRMPSFLNHNVDPERVI